MPSIFPTIDTTPDLDFGSPRKAGGGERTLLLAPPSVAAREDALRDLFQTFNRATSDLQMLDRLSSGLATLPDATYDLVLLLADTDAGGQTIPSQWLSRKVYTAIVPSMKVGAKLRAQYGPLGTTEAREAILAGLAEKDGSFQKVEDEGAVVSLRFGKKSKVVPQRVEIDLDDISDYEDGDDLIDEDTLLTEEDLKRLPQQPPECQPKPGKKRRACKDCTCGLAERLEDQDKTRRAKADKDLGTLKLKVDDLTELDFTQQGKTGSCNSCSLGDAYRCADCPWTGFPAFKPGEEVMLLKNPTQF